MPNAWRARASSALADCYGSAAIQCSHRIAFDLENRRRPGVEDRALNAGIRYNGQVIGVRHRLASRVNKASCRTPSAEKRVSYGRGLAGA